MDNELMFREVLELCYNRGLLPNEASLMIAIEHVTIRERERCAKVAEEFAPAYGICHKIAKKIRAGT